MSVATSTPASAGPPTTLLPVEQPTVAASARVGNHLENASTWRMEDLIWERR